MISQLPTIIYAVSLARTKAFSTPLAELSIHHLEENFFFGFKLCQELYQNGYTRKTLIDIIYLSAAKSRLFRSLPEVESPKNFNLNTAQSIISHISPRAVALWSKTALRNFLKKPCPDLVFNALPHSRN